MKREFSVVEASVVAMLMPRAHGFLVWERGWICGGVVDGGILQNDSGRLCIAADFDLHNAAC